MRLSRRISLLMSVAFAATAIAQPVYPARPQAGPVVRDPETRDWQVPFASTGNTIELAVANTSNIPISNVEVRISNAPSWLKFTSTQQKLTLVKPNEEAPVVFSFSVDKAAPVKSEQTLRFVITNANGEVWTKEIKLVVAAPEKFELFQNYPNPFNPTTTISYQLSADSRVSLKIFNLLGQEIRTLVESEQPAGYHQETLEAHSFSSGVYVYQLVLTDERSHREVVRKAMLLLK